MDTQTHQGPVVPPLKNMAPAQAPATPEPTLVIPGIPSPIQARHLTLASAHFEPRTNRFWHSNRQLFLMPKAPKGELRYLRVYDSQQFIPQFASFNEPPGLMPAPVPVETIARDLVDGWSWMQLSRQKNLRVGIDLIAGDEATDAEKKKLIDTEERLCRAAVNEADQFHKSGKGEITDFHRSCLDWLGSEKRDWYNEIQLGRTKISPISGTRIPMEAMFDQGQSLVKFYVEMGLDPAEFGDDHIAAFLKKKPEIRQKFAQK